MFIHRDYFEIKKKRERENKKKKSLFKDGVMRDSFHQNLIKSRWVTLQSPFLLIKYILLDYLFLQKSIFFFAYFWKKKSEKKTYFMNHERIFYTFVRATNYLTHVHTYAHTYTYNVLNKSNVNIIPLVTKHFVTFVVRDLSRQQVTLRVDPAGG